MQFYGIFLRIAEKRGVSGGNDDLEMKFGSTAFERDTEGIFRDVNG